MQKIFDILFQICYNKYVNRGADEHQYPSQRCGHTLSFCDETGKGISAEARTSPFALGIRENTRMTVTHREELFIPNMTPLSGNLVYCFFQAGL
ncbi:MAG: hypothetical protein IJX88_05495 [Clostridia bacterium]|nr:hypothetical protein [Clostridia bacterium]